MLSGRDPVDIQTPPPLHIHRGEGATVFLSTLISRSHYRDPDNYPPLYTPSRHKTLKQCWFNVNQHWFNVLSLLGTQVGLYSGSMSSHLWAGSQRSQMSTPPPPALSLKSFTWRCQLVRCCSQFCLICHSARVDSRTNIHILRWPIHFLWICASCGCDQLLQYLGYFPCKANNDNTCVLYIQNIQNIHVHAYTKCTWSFFNIFITT